MNKGCPVLMPRLHEYLRASLVRAKILVIRLLMAAVFLPSGLKSTTTCRKLKKLVKGDWRILKAVSS